ncbi:serine/threonine-protein kinase haspin [Perognathus longimembris pacificus]|uniref:serine/threonine-protein kinase haspin n=1 Tax=Perognathus longimembris pacificus TaxID=214514 RepID=UPI0020191DF4|nr:serine/threonine-protein kinase haspin [Perognathus longimembris pacificus]
MATSFQPPGSRLLRTYGAGGGGRPRRRPGETVVHWFSPQDRRRFFSSGESSPSVASDDPDDPDFPGSPVTRPRRTVTARPRRPRLRARPPQKCSTPCSTRHPPLFPSPGPSPRCSGRDPGVCGLPGGCGALDASASLFSSPAPSGSPGSPDAAPRGRRLPAPRPSRESATGEDCVLRETTFSALDSSGNLVDAKGPRQREGLKGPSTRKSRAADGRGPGGCQGLHSPGEIDRPVRAGPSRKRKHQEAGEISAFHYHQTKSGQKMEKDSYPSQNVTHLDKACSWAKTRASLNLHKKKVVTDVSEVCSTHTIATSLSGSLLSECSNLSIMNGTNSALGSWLSSSMHLLSPLKTVHVPDRRASGAEKVYGECNQEGPIPFISCFPTEKLKHCEKIGEGVFGEVFQTMAGQTPVALKIIAIEGASLVNGSHQKTFEEILPEIIISKELSLLSDETCNRTEGFIGLNSVHCVQGSYPPLLLKAWDHYNSTKGSQNDRPDIFEENQLFIVLEFEFGGMDLEQMRTKLASFATAKSILHQITASLAVAETALRFEHRDLHWGNVLLKKTNRKELHYTLNGETSTIRTHGLQVNIIDYTLSRVERDGIVVFCDISMDEDLFRGEGDYQFEIYRLMRKENNNCWDAYHPYNNVLWLHYLTDKILKQMTFRSKCNTPAMKQMKKKLQHFHRTALDFRSATDLLCQHSLFQ